MAVLLSTRPPEKRESVRIARCTRPISLTSLGTSGKGTEERRMRSEPLGVRSKVRYSELASCNNEPTMTWRPASEKTAPGVCAGNPGVASWRGLFVG
jgi:hypothetical protein